MLWMTLGCTSIIEESRNFPCRFMMLKWISTGLISFSAIFFSGLPSAVRPWNLFTGYSSMPRWHPFVFCNVKLQGNLRTHRFLTFLSWLSDCVTSRREKKVFSRYEYKFATTELWALWEGRCGGQVCCMGRIEKRCYWHLLVKLQWYLFGIWRAGSSTARETSHQRTAPRRKAIQDTQNQTSRHLGNQGNAQAQTTTGMQEAAANAVLV